MITCHLMGGLGNQLFQIFTTISLAIQTNQPFYFLNLEKLDGGKRHTYWDTLLICLKPFLRENIHPNSFFLRETCFHYNSLQIDNRPSTVLYGYFQSYKYFNSCRQTICKMLQIETKKQQLLNKLSIPFVNAVSCHFRLGDYKKLAHIYPILDESYYMNALSLVSSQDKSIKTILYFCEEKEMVEVETSVIPFLRESFKDLDFVKCPSGLQDWEQMLLMSCCQHNIIANSTFSWWGAYLNENKSKQVCYPAKWFQEEAKFNIQDLCPPSWVSIK